MDFKDELLILAERVGKAKGDKTLIRTLEQVDNQPKVYTVNESYPEIRRLIEDALR